jgi:hypothetical protein
MHFLIFMDMRICTGKTKCSHLLAEIKESTIKVKEKKRLIGRFECLRHEIFLTGVYDECIHTYLCVDVHTYEHVHACLHARIHTNIYEHMHTYKTYILTHAYAS